MARQTAKTRSMGTKTDTQSSSSGLPAPSPKRLTKRAKLEKSDTHRVIPRAEVEDESLAQTPKRKGKAKAQEIDESTFIPRIDTPWKVGAHVSAAGGVENAVLNAVTIGCNAFALFLKSQRKWTSPPMSDSNISEFKRRMTEYGYEMKHVVPHGSYLINLGNPDQEKREKSYECFLDDLKRCELLGIELYNFHPGSTVGQTTVENSLSLIAESINRAHKATKTVTVLLENMAGAGNVIGGDFAHLAGIIKQVEDKSRVGVCFDTCHGFAAGYDFRTKQGWEETLTKFSNTIGLSYLRAFHLNDSMCGLGSKRDRHANIGMGYLGQGFYDEGDSRVKKAGSEAKLDKFFSTQPKAKADTGTEKANPLGAFQWILRDPRTQNIPMILETPCWDEKSEAKIMMEVWGVEIGVLGRLGLAKGGDAHDEGAEVDDDTLRAMHAEIEDAVKRAKARSVNGKATKGKKDAKSKTVGKRKRSKKDESEEETEEGE